MLLGLHDLAELGQRKYGPLTGYQWAGAGAGVIVIAYVMRPKGATPAPATTSAGPALQYVTIPGNSQSQTPNSPVAPSVPSPVSDPGIVRVPEPLTPGPRLPLVGSPAPITGAPGPYYSGGGDHGGGGGAPGAGGIPGNAPPLADVSAGYDPSGVWHPGHGPQGSGLYTDYTTGETTVVETGPGTGWQAIPGGGAVPEIPGPLETPVSYGANGSPVGAYTGPLAQIPGVTLPPDGGWDASSGPVSDQAPDITILPIPQSDNPGDQTAVDNGNGTATNYDAGGNQVGDAYQIPDATPMPDAAPTSLYSTDNGDGTYNEHFSDGTVVENQF